MRALWLLAVVACSKSDPKPPAPSKPARVALECPAGTTEKTKPWRQQVAPNSVSTEGEQAWCERADGQRHGPLRITYMNGKRAAEGAYADGARDGAWSVWYGDADRPWKASEQTWRAGKRTGTWRSFRPDSGKPWGEGRYDDDGKLVSWIEYGEDGKPVEKPLPADEPKPIDE